jgi:hypothetical protein
VEKLLFFLLHCLPRWIEAAGLDEFRARGHFTKDDFCPDKDPSFQTDGFGSGPKEIFHPKISAVKWVMKQSCRRKQLNNINLHLK